MLVLWLRSPIALTARGKRLLALMRLGAIALIVVAMARPVQRLDDRTARRSAVFAVDVSQSISEGAAMKAREAVTSAAQAARKAGVTPRLVLFARKPLAVENGVEGWDATSPDREATDIEAALNEARAQIEPGETARVFLLSDGNSTAGDLEAGVERMRRLQVPLFPLVLEPAGDPGIAICAFEVPERVFAGDVVEATVRIAPSRAGAGHLTIEREGAKIAEQPVHFDAGENVVPVRLRKESTPGLVRFHAVLDRLTVSDRYAQDNEAHALTTVQAVPRVMLVSDHREPEEPLRAALASQGIQFDLVPPQKVPREPAALGAYSCVVLDDVQAKDFPPYALDAIERFNKEMGGGFVMTGGRQSYAAGGYVKTPIEKMLPVEMPTRSYSTSSAVILLLDNSGSMAGRPLDIAKSAAKGLMRMLKGRLVGMWKFSGGTAEIFPPTLIGEDFSMIDARIDPIMPEGGTQFQPPLMAAMKSLEGAGVSNKYVILMSDGEPGDGYGLLDMVDDMHRKGIKISTVGIGNFIDPVLMQDIAKHGGGRYHQPNRLEDLESTFRDEASHIVEGTPMIDEPFAPALVRPHAIVRGFKPGAFPTLGGYVGTTLRPRAEMVLVSDKGDPVLAVWRHGLGVSVAWTPDAGGQWARQWVQWEGYARFWAQVVKGTFRSNESDYALRTQIRGQTGEVAVDAIDRQGNYLNFLPLFAQVTGPDGRTRKVELPQRDPGRYASTFTAGQRGFYRIEVFRRDREKAVAVGGAVMSAAPELVARPPATATLERIAQITGGQRLADAAALIDAAAAVPAGTAERARELWPPFVVLALLVFFAEVALRRTGVFVIDPSDAADGAAQALTVAESFLRMARDCDAGGDRARAQDYYLKAHSHFLKARREEEAKRMWERYRLLEERRGT